MTEAGAADVVIDVRGLNKSFGARHVVRDLVELSPVRSVASVRTTTAGSVIYPTRTGITNARTEGFNRIIKQTKRVGCGFRNMINYQRRILTHIAVTRPRWSTA